MSPSHASLALQQSRRESNDPPILGVPSGSLTSIGNHCIAESDPSSDRHGAQEVPTIRLDEWKGASAGVGPKVWRRLYIRSVGLADSGRKTRCHDHRVRARTGRGVVRWTDVVNSIASGACKCKGGGGWWT